MKVSEIKARIASMLDVDLNDITLRKSEQKGGNIEMKNGKIVITYSDPDVLVHEFLHGCFTPRDVPPTKLLNALEDRRISAKAYEFDKELAIANRNIVSKDDIMGLIKRIKPADESWAAQQKADRDRLLTAICTPKGIELDLDEVFKEKFYYPKDMLMDCANKAAMLDDEPSLSKLASVNAFIDSVLDFNEKENEQHMDSGFSTFEEDQPNIKKDVESNLQKSISVEDCPELSKTEEFVLRSGIRKIIQNRSIGHKYNSDKGKLESRRLGRYPGKYLFSQKTKPSPETVLYVMADFSGSMYPERLEKVRAFLNTALELNIKNFRVEVRGFNTVMFTQDQIPKDGIKFRSRCLEDAHPETEVSFCEFNDDAHFLNEIVQEVVQDPTENKALLILSDGQPAPSGVYNIRDLKHIVNTVLLRSGIPYMSIGIESKCVKDYYPKYKVANSTTELTSILNRYAKELVRSC
jgi:hypothetical protein